MFEWVHLPAAALTSGLRHLPRTGRTDSSLPAVGVCPIVQQELDHLLVPGAGAVKQGRPAVDVLHLQLCALLQGNREWPLLLPPSHGPPCCNTQRAKIPGRKVNCQHTEGTLRWQLVENPTLCVQTTRCGYTCLLRDTHLQEEVSDALVSTAGGQHERRLPFWSRDVHVHACLQQQVHDGVVADVGGIHQRSPATAVPLIQIHISTKSARKEFR